MNGKAVRAWNRAGTVLSAIAGVAVLVRWTLQDRWVVTGLVYYALPWIAIGVLLFGATLAWWRGRRPRAALAALGLAVGASGVGIQHHYRPNACAGEPGDLKLVVWNAGHGGGGWRRIAAQVNDLSPDLAVLVEAAPRRPPQRSRVQGYTVVSAGAGIVVLARGTVEGVRRFRLGGRSRAVLAEIGIRGQRYTLVAVDIESSPWASRLRRIRRLREIVEQSTHGRPIIVAGDFNTPRDSVAFGGWSMDNTFDRAGRGWAPTFPAWSPLLDIDQAWVSREIQVRCSHTVPNAPSDHRPLVVHFAGNPGEASSTAALRTRAPTSS